MKPRVHEAAGVPAEIERELVASFDLVGSSNGADGVIVTPAIRVDAAFLDAAGPQLRIVANYAVGIDNIDLEAVRAREVVVSNTPGVLTNATAEHAVALMLALLRRVVEGDRSLRRRDPWEWGPDFMVGEGLEERWFSSSGRAGSAGAWARSSRHMAPGRSSQGAMRTCAPCSARPTSSRSTAR